MRKALSIFCLTILLTFAVSMLPTAFSMPSVRINLDTTKTGWTPVIINLKQPATPELASRIPFFELGYAIAGRTVAALNSAEANVILDVPKTLGFPFRLPPTR